MDRTDMYADSKLSHTQRVEADAVSFDGKLARDAGSADFIKSEWTRSDLLKMVWAALGANGYVPDAYDDRETFTKDQLYALLVRIWTLQNPTAIPEELQHANDEATRLGCVTFPPVEDWMPDMELPPSLYLSKVLPVKYRAFTRNRAVGNKYALASDPTRAVGAVAADLDEDDEWVTDYGADGVRVLVDEYVRADTGEFQPFYTADETEIGCPSCTFPTLSWTEDLYDEDIESVADDTAEGTCPRCGDTTVVEPRTCIHIKK